MSHDPLSPATRTTKRNLLAASVMAITYSAFDIHISKLPIAGLAIDFDDRVFSFLLLSVLFYFSVTFAVYYFVDIRNLEKTPHELENEKSTQYSQNAFWSTHAKAVLGEIGDAIAPNVVVTHPATLGNLFQKMEEPFFDMGKVDNFCQVVASELRIVLPKSATREHQDPLSRDANSDLYARADAIIRKAFIQYLAKRRCHRQRMILRLRAVRIFYYFRNRILDGYFPFVLALIAFASLLHIIDLHWLRYLVPHSQQLPISASELPDV